MDCRTCKHNSYRDIKTDFVSCCHPMTLAKSPRPADGDPAWVNYMTADIHISRLADLDSCPTWEAAKVVHAIEAVRDDLREIMES